MFRRLVASLLIFSLITPLPAHAGMVTTHEALDRDRITSVLDRADEQAYGVSPSEVKARIAALTDAEAAELAARIDSLPAGGIGIIGAILVVFLVLLITDILGLTKVFPFTRPMR
jgi:hypothetical protein